MIKLFTKRCSILLILWFSTGIAAAAPNQDSLSYHIQQFTSENGLPQNSVKSIAQCRNGFIWMTTEGGLVRFDGRNFKVYTRHDIPVSSNRMRYFVRGLKSGRLYTLAEDDQLIHITGTRVTALPKYYKSFSTFILPQGAVSAYRSIGMPNISGMDLPAGTVYQLPLDTQRTFLADRDTVRFFERKQEQWKLPFPNDTYWHFFTLGRDLYYLDKGNAIARIREDTVQAVHLEGDILSNPAYSAKRSSSLYWNQASGDVFLYLNKSLYLLEARRGGRLATRLLLSDFNFNLNNIYSVHYDRKNERLFLGSQTKGLFVIKRRPFRTLLFRMGGSGNEIYYAQMPYGEDKVLTSRGVIMGAGGFRDRLSLVDYYADRYSLITDSLGNIWTKKTAHVYQLSSGGDRLMSQFTLPASVSQLYMGQKGRIWIGTDSGLYYLNPGEREVQHAFSTRGEVSYIIQEVENTIWVGTKSGLYQFSPKEMKADTIPGLGSSYIRSIYVSSPGEVWLTTAENGLFLYMDRKLTAFPLDKKGYLASSHCILEDKQGYFWISTNRGLFQAAKQDLLDFARQELDDIFYVYYGKDAGFNTNEFNGGCQPCGMVLENGYFSFPSLNGLVWFKPPDVHAELPDNGIYIDEIGIDSTVAEVKDTLKLDARFNRMQVFFTTPYFADPYNLSFKYRLKGPSGSNDWLEVKGENMISFSSLQSGTYRLTIRKQKGFHASGYIDKQLVIIIPPVFYETWWFRILVLIGALLGVLFYIRLRLKSIKRRNDDLEKRILERTLKLKQTILAQQASKDKLRQQNYLQQRLLAAITHDVKSPLQYLALTTKTLYEQYPARRQENIADDLGKVYQSSSRVYHFTENLVQYMKVNMAGCQLSNGEVRVFDLVNEKISIFSDLAESKGNKVENVISRDIHIRTNEQLLGIVIHNLLDNAIKFTRSGCIRFSSVSAGSNPKIILEDTGKGMNDELIEWCNSFRSRHNDQERAAFHQGLGLTIVMELLAMIDGNLHVEKTIPGTRIELLL